MASDTYSAESYMPRYSPENSVYQDDARIFHRSGYAYEFARSVVDGRIDPDGAFSATVRMGQGPAASLRLVPCGRDTLRLLFGPERFEPAEPSPMLVGGRLKPSGKLALRETPTSYVLRWAGRVIEIGRETFSLRALGPGGREIFALETESVAGEYCVGPLGFRLTPDGRREAFLSWRIRNDERFFGLGEKWCKVEKTSTRATIWASDCCGTNTTDMAYKSVPVLHSTRGWGLMLHTGYRTRWEIGTFAYTGGSALSEEPRLDAALWFAPSLAESIGVYTRLTGRPERPPRWAYGLWMSRCAYENRPQVEAVLQRLRAEKIPCDVIHLDPLWMKTHYYFKIGVDACDFEWRTEAWPQPEEMLRQWKEWGFATCFWVNPYVPEGGPMYEEAKAKGYLLRSARGGIARLAYGEPVGMVDFTHPEAKAWWKAKLVALARMGAAVFKPDYGDRVPEDAVFHDGRTGRELHSVYLHLFAEACFEAAREANGEGVVWRRAGYIGTQRYPGTWAGDTQITWEAMRCCLRGGLSAAFNGEAFWSHDMGGFVGPKPDPELYIRWAQWGLLSPFSRFHGTSPREPWEYGPEALRIVRRYAQLRYRLMPYLWRCGEEAAQTGMPIMRHMKLAFPDEAAVEHIDDQYLLGPDLLVAPVFAAGQRRRELYVPRGRWRLWDRPAQVYTGPGWRVAPAPLERIPLLVRAGARVPVFASVPDHLSGKLPKVTALAFKK